MGPSRALSISVLENFILNERERIQNTVFHDFLDKAVVSNLKVKFKYSTIRIRYFAITLAQR
jgi:hypothetical protein